MDHEHRYSVVGYPGVAFWFKKHPVEQRGCQGHPCEDAADLYPNAGIGEVFYCDGECEEPTENTDLAVMVMVGDDREHVIDVDDCIPIDDNDYCHVCGQIGCGHDGIDRE